MKNKEITLLEKVSIIGGVVIAMQVAAIYLIQLFV